MHSLSRQQLVIPAVRSVIPMAALARGSGLSATIMAPA
jgi:hypothetical protein